MKKTIYKSFIQEFLKIFFLSLFALTLIVWIMQAVNYLDFVSEDGHGFKVYFTYTILSLPKILSRLMMFVFFISLFYSLYKMEEKNELIIYWINGIKKISVKRFIISLSLIFLFFQLLFNIFITPKSQDLARSYLRGSNIDFFPSLIKEKKFIDIVSNLTIFVENKNEDGSFENIFLKEYNGSSNYQIIFAKYGKIKTDNNVIALELNNGNIIDRVNDEEKIISFDTTIFNLSKYQTKTITQQKIQEVNTLFLLNCLNNIRNNKDIEYLNIYRADHQLKCNNQIIKTYYEELFKRIVHPFYIPLLAVIAALAMLDTKNIYNYSMKRIYLFLIGFAVIVFGEISVKYTSENLQSNLNFVLVPIVLFIIINIFFNIKSQKN
tara:strand:- start:7043 stop:8179 length:1137 start_codon:yes stop_codon:yes gene_type:complete